MATACVLITPPFVSKRHRGKGGERLRDEVSLSWILVITVLVGGHSHFYAAHFLQRAFSSEMYCFNVGCIFHVFICQYFLPRCLLLLL